MKQTRTAAPQTRRDAWVEVDLGAIEHNINTLRASIPKHNALMAIVKADAYGHGAAMVIPTLEASGVTSLGVASMDEAIQLRDAGVELPVLVIGAIPDWAVQVAADRDITLTIFSQNHLESLRQAFDLVKKPVKVHVKVDTGMHRIGVDWEQAAEFVKHCRNVPYLELEGVFSHLACSDDPKFSGVQIERWQQVLAAIADHPPWIHMTNSDGAVRYPNCPGNMARLGVGLFGYGVHNQVPLKPTMGLKARIIRLQDVPPESGIGYDHTYITPKDKTATIATVPLGYADGIPRVLTNKIHGLLKGRRVPQVGSITMDQTMFDVSAVPDAQVGEVITLVGRDGDETITLTDWAKLANTIEYELMCALRVRLPKVYTR